MKAHLSNMILVLLVIAVLFILNAHFEIRPIEAASLGERFEIALSDADIQKAKSLADRYLKKKAQSDDSTNAENSTSEASNSQGDAGSGSSDDSSGQDDSKTAADTGASSSDKSSDKTPTTGISSPAEPGDSIDSSPKDDAAQPPHKKVDPSDLMYAQAHMKLAKRAFAAKNMDKAKAELSLIFERVPDYAEARFMRAVIAAREKEFIEAWRHITIAQRSAPDNQKIKEFIDRLQKAYPKPDVLPEASLASRPKPAFASEMVAQSLEKLFADKTLSDKLTNVSATNFTEEGGVVKVTLTLESSEALNTETTKSALKSAFAATVGEPKIASEGKILEFPLEISDLPLKNPAVKAVPEALSDFLKGVSEETDVAIQDSSESDPDSNKQQVGTYSVAASGIKTLVDFLTKVGPYSVEYSINNFKSSTFGGKAIWKGELKIKFQLP